MSKKPQITKKILTAEGPNGEDIEQHIRTSDNFVVKEVLISEDAQGNEVRRPRAVPMSSQPLAEGEEIEFELGSKDKTGPGDTAKTRLISAAEMASKAVKLREETVGAEARELCIKILEEAATRALDGLLEYLLTEEVKGEVVQLCVKELKDLGYKVTKHPIPGEGVYICLRWPTRKTTPRKKKKVAKAPTPETAEELKFKKANQSGPKKKKTRSRPRSK